MQPRVPESDDSARQSLRRSDTLLRTATSNTRRGTDSIENVVKPHADDAAIEVSYIAASIPRTRNPFATAFGMCSSVRHMERHPCGAKSLRHTAIMRFAMRY